MKGFEIPTRKIGFGKLPKHRVKGKVGKFPKSTTANDIYIDIYEGFQEDIDKKIRDRKVADVKSERESREVPERVRSDISRGVVLGRL